MKRFASMPRRTSLVLSLLALGLAAAGCSPEPAGPTAGGSGGAGVSSGGAGVPGTGGGSGGGSGAINGSSGGTVGSGGVAATGGTSSGGASATGGASSSSGGGPGSGGVGTGGASSGGRGGVTGSGGVGGARVGSGGAGGTGGAGNCNLPATVSYQRDVQGFLIKSCGGGNGCHVIDTQSTVSAGGFNHGYDWITAGAHAFSCPTTPKRFEVVIDVINQANPASCSKSRKMPPPNATGAGIRDPLTPCQIATLQAWLNEPLVTQTHRADDSSPTTPYPMPPFN